MNYLKSKIRRFLFKLKKINNLIYCIFNNNKFKHRIAIISCDKWKDNVKEDILLKIELNKALIDAEIISWQDKTIDYTKYDAIIIRSIWGYQDYIEEFLEWVNTLKNNKVRVFNSPEILLSNLNKYNQFKTLDQNKIPHIETIFINKDDIEIEKIENLYKKYESIVLKPVISGSGNNTFTISNKIKKNNIKLSEVNEKFSKVLNDINRYLMVQPFVKEINEGELSVVVISKKISHAAIRYTNIFNDINQIKIVDVGKLDEKVVEIVNKCIGIEEYNDSLYMRIDLVKIDSEYKVMEIELVEPQLFFEFKQNKSKLKEFVKVVNNIISK